MNQEIKKFIFYVSPEGKVAVDVLVHDETVWLTQKKVGEPAAVSKMETAAEGGKIYKTQSQLLSNT